MITDVLGSGPFKQPFNKTSSAVRHTGSLMLGSPPENNLPPVSKPSAFGSPRRASIILQGLFKLVGKVSAFSYSNLHDILDKSITYATDFLWLIELNLKSYTNFVHQKNGNDMVCMYWVGHTCSFCACGISMG